MFLDEDHDEGDTSYEMRAAKRRKAKQAKMAAVAAQKRLEQERMALLESEVRCKLIFSQEFNLAYCI